MKQLLGIRFSEHGQTLIGRYEAEDGAPLIPVAHGVMMHSAQGPSFGRVVWQRTFQDEEFADAASKDWIAPQDAMLADANGSPEQHADGARQPGRAPEAALPGEDGVARETEGDTRPESPRAHGGQNGRPKNGPNGRPLPPLVRPATADELAAAAQNEALCREARAYCRARISERRLDMKLVDVETLFDRGKMIFYFTAPTRIDFRDLVKDLVRQYRTRIELRQIGVRHETQMVGSLGNCGMVCCCRRYLRKFAPVTIKMAKEQNLFLNPSKISGICGRLLCCLSYEQENYDAFHRNCPRLGKRYQTDLGPMRVLRGNMFRNTVSVLPDGGPEAEYTLDEWQALNPARASEPAPPPPKPRPEDAAAPDPKRRKKRKPEPADEGDSAPK